MLNKVEPLRTWRYHPFYAASGRIFLTDEIESLPIGWVDTPDKFDEARAAIKDAGMPEPVVEIVREKPEPPLPGNFSGIDEFMEAFVASSDLPEAERSRNAALKAGVEQYVLTKYGVSMDRRESLERLREQALAFDAEG